MSAPFMTPQEPLPPHTAAAPVPLPASFARPVKQPVVALLLSLVMPGVGQVYNGHTAKALVFFAAFVSSIYLAATVNGLPFGFFIPFSIFYAMIDAYRSAGLINARNAGLPPDLEEDNPESPAWGAALVGIGLVLLLNNLGWLRLDALRQYWPLLLVIAGVALLRGALRRKAVGDGNAL